jgi:uncharacterized protein YdhG (YjbR/CyaY superfamily)
VVSAADVDRYLEQFEEPLQSTLRQLRRSILGVVPEAEQCLSYGVPAFRLRGKNIAGFAAAKRHVSYLPHSGTVLSTLSEAELCGLKASKGALQMPVDQPIDSCLVATLIAARRAEAGV